MKNKLHKIAFLSAIIAGTIIPLEEAESTLGRNLHSPTTIIQKNLGNLLESDMLGNFLPEPEIPKVENQELPRYDGSRRLNNQTLDEFIDFIY